MSTDAFLRGYGDENSGERYSCPVCGLRYLYPQLRPGEPSYLCSSDVHDRTYLKPERPGPEA